VTGYIKKNLATYTLLLDFELFIGERCWLPP
jgi:hypothetical protein